MIDQISNKILASSEFDLSDIIGSLHNLWILRLASPNNN